MVSRKFRLLVGIPENHRRSQIIRWAEVFLSWPPLSKVIYSKSCFLIVKLRQMHQEADPLHPQSLATCRGKKVDGIQFWTVLTVLFEHLFWDCWTTFLSKNKVKKLPHWFSNLIFKSWWVVEQKKVLQEEVGVLPPPSPPH